MTAFGSDFLSLAWLSPEGISADLYRVRCRSEQTAVDEVAYTVQPNITVRSLQPHSTYSFAVSLSSVMYSFAVKVAEKERFFVVQLVLWVSK